MAVKYNTNFEFSRYIRYLLALVFVSGNNNILYGFKKLCENSNYLNHKNFLVSLINY